MGRSVGRQMGKEWKGSEKEWEGIGKVSGKFSGNVNGKEREKGEIELGAELKCLSENLWKVQFSRKLGVVKSEKGLRRSVA